MAEDRWELAGLSLGSRLLLGTARYPSRQVLLDALAASGAELVTVAVRRVGLGAGAENLYDALRGRGLHLLPNTAGCFTARDAVLTAELGREALGTDIVKLEVIADEDTLLPDVEGLLAAARELVGEGLPGPALHQRRPGDGEAAGGPGVRGGHAARRADRLGPRHPEPPQHRADPEPGARSRRGGRRRGDRLRRRHRLRAGRRRRPAQHGRGAGPGSRSAWRAPCGTRRWRGRDAWLAGRMPRKFYAEASSPWAGRIETGPESRPLTGAGGGRLAGAPPTAHARDRPSGDARARSRGRRRGRRSRAASGSSRFASATFRRPRSRPCSGGSSSGCAGRRRASSSTATRRSRARSDIGLHLPAAAPLPPPPRPLPLRPGRSRRGGGAPGARRGRVIRRRRSGVPHRIEARSPGRRARSARAAGPARRSRAGLRDRRSHAPTGLCPCWMPGRTVSPCAARSSALRDPARAARAFAEALNPA